MTYQFPLTRECGWGQAPAENMRGHASTLSSLKFIAPVLERNPPGGCRRANRLSPYQVRGRLCRFVILFVLVVLVLPGCAERNTGTGNEPVAISEVLRGDPAQTFARVDEPREFRFPADHGRHDEFRTEWWYFTGNVNDANDHHFGYQLTFFRFRPKVVQTGGASRWRTEHVYMAHFALSDISNGKIHTFERFSRGAAGLAGANTNRLHVWLDDWSAGTPSGEAFPLHMRAREDQVALALTLQQGKPVVLHGKDGVSVKNSEPGNASYYYSYTRMPTEGRVSVADKTYQVRGNSWMDREWSSSALGKEQLGWDWFALQLSNDYELMYYRFRRTDATLDRFSYGAVVLPDGQVHTLGFHQVELDILDTWRSPGSGVIYPSAWRLRIPEYDIDLRVRPALADQELDLSFRYWEGAVEFEGSFGESDVDGRGYVELTGYGTTTAPRTR